MIDWIRKNNKKILAFIGVFLMIAFIVPNVAQRSGPQGQITATIDGKKISNTEYQAALRDWQVLTQHMRTENGVNAMEYSLAQHLVPRNLMSMLGPQQIQQAYMQAAIMVRRLDPMSYLLLLKEAQQMNAFVSDEEVQQLLSIFPPKGGDEKAVYEIAARDWLSIINSFNRVASSVKISPAIADHAMAASGQKATINLVEFPVQNFAQQVTPPTPEQLQTFFEKHRDISPAQDKFGIGYRYPDRVQVEYIQVPKAPIRQTISNEEVVRYWKDNQTKYLNTPAASTQSTTQPATQPTVKPWHEVQDEIRDELAEIHAAAMIKSIGQLFAADWPGWRQAVRTSGSLSPQNAPPTSVGSPYSSYEYVEKLRDRAQALKESRGVMPRTVSTRLLSQSELAGLEQVGDAELVRPSGQFDGPGFAAYATQLLEPLMSPKDRKQAAEQQLQPIALFQPSPPLRDPEGNYYIFRVTKAEPAHAAKTVDELDGRVRDDYIAMQAFEDAKTAAGQLLSQVNGQDLTHAAAATPGLNVVQVGPFSNRPQKLENYPLPEWASRDLIRGAFDLVTQRLSTGKEHPAAIIELPSARRVVVAQLVNAEPATESPFAQFQREQAKSQIKTSLLVQWFDPDAIHERMKFTEAEPAKAQEKYDPLTSPPKA